LLAAADRINTAEDFIEKAGREKAASAVDRTRSGVAAVKR